MRKIPWSIFALAALFVPLSTSAPPDSRTFVGAQTCGGCHARAFTIWAGGDHSRAALVFGMQVGRDMIEAATRTRQTISCGGCHAPPDSGQAFPMAASFRREDGVQCETCHGPGSAHVELRTNRGGNVTGSALLPVRADTSFCLSCHRNPKPLHERSPARPPPFEMSTFWKRIQHSR